GAGDGGNVADADGNSGGRVFDDDLTDFAGRVNLAADKSENELMVIFKEAGRIDKVGAANGVEDVSDGDAGSDEAGGIGSDLIFRDAAALNEHGGDAIKTIDAGLDVIGSDFPKAIGRNRVRGKAVADDGESSEGEAVGFEFGGGRKFGLQASNGGVDALQGHDHIVLPFKEEINFSGAAAGNGDDTLEAGDIVHGLFDGAGDGDQHLVNRHDAVV